MTTLPQIHSSSVLWLTKNMRYIRLSGGQHSSWNVAEMNTMMPDYETYARLFERSPDLLSAAKKYAEQQNDDELREVIRYIEEGDREHARR